MFQTHLARQLVGLRFDLNSTDALNPPTASWTSGAGAAYTLIAWIRQNGTITTDNRGLAQCGANDMLVYESGATPAWRHIVERATTTSDRRVVAGANSPVGGDGNIGFVALPYDEAGGARMFFGHQLKLAAELTYDLNIVGSGNTTAQTSLILGNRSTNTGWPVDIGLIAWYNRAFSESDIRHMQFRPELDHCMGMWVPGLDGNTKVVRDLTRHGRHAIGAGTLDIPTITTTAAKAFPAILLPQWGTRRVYFDVAAPVTAQPAVVRVMFNKLRPRIFAPGLAR
jgi:hypothetical protein